VLAAGSCSSRRSSAKEPQLIVMPAQQSGRHTGRYIPSAQQNICSLPETSAMAAVATKDQLRPAKRHLLSTAQQKTNGNCSRHDATLQAGSGRACT
jgi:hypothetical protein